MQRSLIALGLTGLFTLACTDKTPATNGGGAAPLAQTDAGAVGAAVAGGAMPGSGMPGSGMPGGTMAGTVPGDTLVGVVREQIPVGPYVYVRLETASGELWAAVNEAGENTAPLTIGSRLTVYNVMAMDNFPSTTLKRTFDRIYFGMREPSAGGAPAAGTAPGGPDMANLMTAGAPIAADAKVGRIARATGPGAKTVGDVWAAKSHLSGATVAVRGVVVKYNPGVMGKNWLHLQDGSGDAGKGTHDLPVTSIDAAAVGDTVTITGTVRMDRDLGAGYIYALIVEDAKITRK